MDIFSNKLTSKYPITEPILAIKPTPKLTLKQAPSLTLIMNIFLVCMLLLLAACSNNTVHLYTRYLSADQTTQIRQKLAEQGIKVKTNEDVNSARAIVQKEKENVAKAEEKLADAQGKYAKEKMSRNGKHHIRTLGFPRMGSGKPRKGT